MNPQPDRGLMTPTELLDLALLGSIAFIIGVSLLPSLNAAGPGHATGSTMRWQANVFDLLQANSSPIELLGVVLTITGALMMLFGPLWILIGRPLSRRNYL